MLNFFFTLLTTTLTEKLFRLPHNRRPLLYIFDQEVAPHTNVISNVNARILNIDQDSNDNSISTIKTEVKRSIVTHVIGNEERDFNYRVT